MHDIIGDDGLQRAPALGVVVVAREQTDVFRLVVQPGGGGWEIRSARGTKLRLIALARDHLPGTWALSDRAMLVVRNGTDEPVRIGLGDGTWSADVASHESSKIPHISTLGRLRSSRRRIKLALGRWLVDVNPAWSPRPWKMLGTKLEWPWRVFRIQVRRDSLDARQRGHASAAVRRRDTNPRAPKT